MCSSAGVARAESFGTRVPPKHELTLIYLIFAQMTRRYGISTQVVKEVARFRDAIRFFVRAAGQTGI